VSAGRSKLCKGLETGADRARNAASVDSAITLGKNTPCVKTGRCHNCASSGVICSTLSITEQCRPAGRIHLLFAGKDLGMQTKSGLAASASFGLLSSSEHLDEIVMRSGTACVRREVRDGVATALFETHRSCPGDVPVYGQFSSTTQIGFPSRSVNPPNQNPPDSS